METNERAIGHLFGIVGGALMWLGGIVAAAFGIAAAAMGHGLGFELALLSEAILLFVVGGLVLLFAHLGEHGWRDRPLASGILLVVLAVVGWGVLGLGGNLLAVVGALFAFLAGVLYLIEPTRHAAQSLVASS
jgi:hypothetical protein